jgi:hypothetical protein
MHNGQHPYRIRVPVPDYRFRFGDSGVAGQVEGNSSAGGGSIFFRRRTPGLFLIVRKLHAVIVRNPRSDRVSLRVRAMRLVRFCSRSNRPSA